MSGSSNFLYYAGKLEFLVLDGTNELIKVEVDANTGQLLSRSDDWYWTKKLAWLMGGAAGGYLLAPAVLTALGFGPGGIIAGSWAAEAMASVGNVASGSAIATATSAAMGGTGAATIGGGAAAAGAAAGVVGEQAKNKLEEALSKMDVVECRATMFWLEWKGKNSGNSKF